jgi:hypothetical protein
MMNPILRVEASFPAARARAAGPSIADGPPKRAKLAKSSLQPCRGDLHGRSISSLVTRCSISQRPHIQPQALG